VRRHDQALLPRGNGILYKQAQKAGDWEISATGGRAGNRRRTTAAMIAQSPPSLTVIEKFHRSINFNSTDKWIKTPP
jgi:hypothetical protein